MANNLRKFNTYSDYQSAELVKPAVSLIAATDEVYFDQKDAPVPPTPTFSGLTVYYNITDTSQPTELFKGGGGSGSGSGSGGALPSAMIIDGTAVEVTNTYQFSTTGEHIINYSFADNTIPENFLDDEATGKFSTVTKVEIGDTLTSIGDLAFYDCSGLTSVTIGSGVTSIGQIAFNNCTILTSISSNAITAPTLGDGVFEGVRSNGVLTVPSGSQGYCGWLGELPSYWTIEGVTCE
jgi:hypothetical protein